MGGYASALDGLERAGLTDRDQACRRAGFLPMCEPRQFLLRDEGGQLPRDLPCHLTMLEADNAYL